MQEKLRVEDVDLQIKIVRVHDVRIEWHLSHLIIALDLLGAATTSRRVKVANLRTRR